MFVALYTVVVLLSNRFQVENFVDSMTGFIYIANTKFVVPVFGVLKKKF